MNLIERISAFREITEKRIEEEYQLEDDIEDKDEEDPNTSLILKRKKVID